MTTTDHRSALAAAIEAQERRYFCFPVHEFFGLGGRPVRAVAIWCSRKTEDNEAITAAHKYVAELAKKAGDGAEAARTDAELLSDTKTIELLFRVCREVDPASIDAAPEDPRQWRVTKWPAFPGPGWMHDRLSTDQLAALLNLYLEVRAKVAPAPEEIGDEAVEAVVKLCEAHAGDDIPEAVLAGFSRSKLTHLVVLLSAKLGAARESVETLLQQMSGDGVEAGKEQANG